jgi:Flp pilus assembly protein TadD
MFLIRNFATAPRNSAFRPGALQRQGLALLLIAGMSLSVRAECTGPRDLSAAAGAHPSVQTWSALGNWFGNHRQFECAAQAFRSAVRLNPKSPQLNYLLGLALYGSNHYAEAVGPLRLSTRGAPSDVRPHLLLASTFSKLNQPVDAANEWHAALRLDPHSSMALHGLSSSLLAMGDFPAEIQLLKDAKRDNDLTVDLATAYAQAGRLDDGIQTVRDALKTSPGSLRLSTAMVRLLDKERRTDQAEKVAEACYAAHPNDYAAQALYLRMLVMTGDWTNAAPLGRKLLAEKPHAFDTLYLNGVLERQRGDYTAAREHLTEAMGLNPTLAIIRYNLGIALNRLHDPAGARTQLEAALALGDPEPVVHFELATALRMLGETAAANTEMLRYQQAMQDKDAATRAVVTAARGDVEMKKGDIGRAVQLYQEAFQDTPKNGYLGYKLAMALDRDNQPEAERRVLQQVIALDATFALAQSQLGYLDSRRGDLAAAEKHFRAAVTSAPGYTEAWISLAATLAMESKFAEGEKAISMALHLDPGNTNAKQLQEQLKSAQGQAATN